MPAKLKRHEQGKQAQKRPAFFSASRSKRISRWSVRPTKRRELSLTLRRFRTGPASRSKKYRQRVYHFDHFGYREAAIVYKQKAKAAKQREVPSYRHAMPAILMILGLAGSIYFALNLSRPVNIKPEHPTLTAASTPAPKPPAPAPPKSLARSIPTRLTIPKIGVDTPVQPSGLDANGQLAVPNGYDVTGWYDKSPTPGEIGPSIIVGHVDYIDNVAVFWRLRELAAGDTFSVTRADGTIANFSVTQIVDFPQDEFPTAQVYGNIDYAGIRLITCGGTFNSSTRHYDHNIVVYGKLL